MKIEELIPFKGKKVAVEIPHRDNPETTFTYWGVLEDVNADAILLTRQNGLRTLITLNRVLEIREEN